MIDKMTPSCLWTREEDSFDVRVLVVRMGKERLEMSPDRWKGYRKMLCFGRPPKVRGLLKHLLTRNRLRGTTGEHNYIAGGFKGFIFVEVFWLPTNWGQ